ncbi:MAG: hydrogenase maturation peptidase HycI [Candidatus Thermoplasmatota archaeon]|nr:hydrogenase maturation peptidase HycI [Candidatus Thermoplasmatota archaeon]
MDFLVMCIGNPQGGDDAIGPYIAGKLKELNIDVIDCGTTPENYTSVVKQINPKKLIIIDAADMGLKPGEIRIVPKEKIGVMTISTHGIPTSVLMNYLEQYVKEVILIGIQPQNMSGEITTKIKEKARFLVESIKDKKINTLSVLK